MIQFLFPEDQSKYQTIKSMDDLRSKIASESQQLDFRIVKYSYTYFHEKYIYVKCKYCKTGKLAFRFNRLTSQYDLRSFNNNHIHSNVKFNRNIQLINFIQNIPPAIKLASAKHLTLKHFRINESTFYYYYKSIHNRQLSLKQLIDEFQQKDYHIYIEPLDRNFSTLLQLIIIVTPLMKANYLKYGDIVGLDFTYKLVKNKNNQRQYKLGVFMGESSTKKIVPFGLVLTLSQSQQRYYQMLTSFRQIMGQLPPILVSDQAVSLISAINEMKQNNQYDGEHMFDVLHILRNIRKYLNNKQSLHWFAKLVKAQSQVQFQKIRQQAYEHLDAEQTALMSKFISEGHHYCFCLSPRRYVGFTSSDYFNQKINDMIKNQIPYAQNFTIVIKKTICLLENIGEKCQNFQMENRSIEEFCHIPQLKQARWTLDKKVLKYLIAQIMKCLFMDIRFLNEEEVFIFDVKNQMEFKVTLHPFLNCQCLYLLRTGIPCAHQIKYLISKGLRILPHVSQRWKRKFQYKRTLPKGPGKKTRTNR